MSTQPQSTTDDLLDSPYLTVGDVARLLNASTGWVYRQCLNGTIPGRKFGGLWRFNRQELIAFLSAETSKGTSPSPSPKPTARHALKQLDSERIVAAWKRRGIKPDVSEEA